MNKEDFIARIERLESDLEKGVYNNPLTLDEWIGNFWSVEWDKDEKVLDRAVAVCEEFVSM
ncbi:MAG: hypothetical protein DRP56_08785 [Planctomycetota bacterium]|nr:MAG: hypothetical protein DRP56_08785 [Planctomycetota bacterium]